MDTEKYIGKRYNRWIILNFSYQKKKSYYFRCRCNCGIEKNVEICSILYGQSKSCGCYAKEIARKLLIDRSYKHGKSERGHKVRLYNIWRGMKSRCYNKNTRGYKYYGSKGIIVCDEWKLDFVKFQDWSLENGYNDNLTIDRIDNAKNYELDNCRWVSVEINLKNKQRKTSFFFRGKYYTLSELAKKYDIDILSLSSRIYRSKWPLEKALLTPVKK